MIKNHPHRSWFWLSHRRVSLFGNNPFFLYPLMCRKCWKIPPFFYLIPLQKESGWGYPRKTQFLSLSRFLFPKQVIQFPLKKSLIIPKWLVFSHKCLRTPDFSPKNFVSLQLSKIFYTGGESLRPNCLPSRLPQWNRLVDHDNEFLPHPEVFKSILSASSQV